MRFSHFNCFIAEYGKLFWWARVRGGQAYTHIYAKYLFSSMAHGRFHQEGGMPTIAAGGNFRVFSEKLLRKIPQEYNEFQPSHSYLAKLGLFWLISPSFSFHFGENFTIFIKFFIKLPICERHCFNIKNKNSISIMFNHISSSIHFVSFQ